MVRTRYLHEIPWGNSNTNIIIELDIPSLGEKLDDVTSTTFTDISEDFAIHVAEVLSSKVLTHYSESLNIEEITRVKVKSVHEIPWGCSTADIIVELDVPSPPVFNKWLVEAIFNSLADNYGVSIKEDFFPKFIIGVVDRISKIYNVKDAEIQV